MVDVIQEGNQCKTCPERNGCTDKEKLSEYTWQNTTNYPGCYKALERMHAKLMRAKR